THKKKIRHKKDPKVPGDVDDDDTWLEVERTDEFTTTTGQGPNFKRTIHKLEWDDDEDSGTFDKCEQLDEQEQPEGAGFNPPWRLDPFQKIVNVQWGGYLALVQFGASFSVVTNNPDWLASPVSSPFTGDGVVNPLKTTIVYLAQHSYLGDPADFYIV